MIHTKLSFYKCLDFFFGVINKTEREGERKMLRLLKASPSSHKKYSEHMHVYFDNDDYTLFRNGVFLKLSSDLLNEEVEPTWTMKTTTMPDECTELGEIDTELKGLGLSVVSKNINSPQKFGLRGFVAFSFSRLEFKWNETPVVFECTKIEDHYYTTCSFNSHGRFVVVDRRLIECLRKRKDFPKDLLNNYAECTDNGAQYLDYDMLEEHIE